MSVLARPGTPTEAGMARRREGLRRRGFCSMTSELADDWPGASLLEHLGWRAWLNIGSGIRWIGDQVDTAWFGPSVGTGRGAKQEM